MDIRGKSSKFVVAEVIVGNGFEVFVLNTPE